MYQGCEDGSVYVLFPAVPQVIVNVAISAMVTYAKVGVTSQLHGYSENQNLALTVGGVVTQLGSLTGALVFFALVYYTNIFQS